ncbi:MAG: hypothetical protein QUU85_14700, partial [Candidatus Eisenbacteria bacterium]|nr:hypothetical protein [Candidatus Eisenbacteria bacterium]
MAGGGFRATGVMIFLLGGVVVLGWLVQQSATAVHRAGEVKQQAVRNVSRDPMIARVMKSDSMLAAIEPPSRDPLGPPPAIGGGAG